MSNGFNTDLPGPKLPNTGALNQGPRNRGAIPANKAENEIESLNSRIVQAIALTGLDNITLQYLAQRINEKADHLEKLLQNSLYHTHGGQFFLYDGIVYDKIKHPALLTSALSKINKEPQVVRAVIRNKGFAEAVSSMNREDITRILNNLTAQEAKALLGIYYNKSHHVTMLRNLISHKLGFRSVANPTLIKDKIKNLLDSPITFTMMDRRFILSFIEKGSGGCTITDDTDNSGLELYDPKLQVTLLLTSFGLKEKTFEAENVKKFLLKLLGNSDRLEVTRVDFWIRFMKSTPVFTSDKIMKKFLNLLNYLKENNDDLKRLDYYIEAGIAFNSKRNITVTCTESEIIFVKK